MLTLSQTLADTLSRYNVNNDSKQILEQVLRSESSSTVQESPVLKPQHQGRKRKRGEDLPTSIPEGRSQKSPSLLSDISPITLFLQDVLRFVTEPNGTDEVTKYQMQTALKADPGTAAVILGGAYRITTQILIDGERSDTDDISCILRLPTTATKLWDIRSSTGEHSTDSTSNVSLNGLGLLQFIPS
jgi:hypothetical protein